MKRKKTIITYGTYDMLHRGHLNLLKRAKALGDYLIVGVTDENYDRSRGKLNVSQSTKKRIKAIKALDFVDKVIVEKHKKQKAIDMRRYNVDIFAIGDDWVGAFDYLNKYTEVRYLPRTEGISSTKLRKKQFSTMKIGIVGLGHKAADFIAESAVVAHLKVKHLYSNDIEALREFKKVNKTIEHGYNNYDKFLKSSIDAVYINTDANTHYNLIEKALKANKHVLCENPLTLSEEDLSRLLKLAKKQDCVLLTALKTAFLPAFNQLIKEVKKGTIGKVQKVKASRSTLYGNRDYPESFLSQGASAILGSYPSLLIYKILGEYRELEFFEQKMPQKDYDCSNLMVSRHKDNTIGVADVSIEAKSEGDAVISGTKGYIYIPCPLVANQDLLCAF
ncbi:MAG: Gfo/Idh/MocA family oxidoreductase [Campylobacterota bacterium]|nr:Gfo/Idh/MocA family oxidoreductase [Campylobacterota bacterium]